MEKWEKRKLLKGILRKLTEHAVLVEGKKDARAIREACGFPGDNVRAVNSRPPERVADETARLGTPVLLLFDFDAEGRRKEREFADAFAARGVKVNGQARKAFRALFRIRTIEELPSAMQELENEIQGG